MMAFAASRAGVGVATLSLVSLVALITVCVLAASSAVARLGVARPDMDVFHVVLERPGREPTRLPGISVGGMVIQLVLNLGAFPAVKLLDPDVFYRPEIGPSPGMLLTTLVIA